MQRLAFIGLVIWFASPALLVAQTAESSLTKSLSFLASFDESADADYARGDRGVYTGKNLERQQVSPGLPAGVASLHDQGRWGRALRFERRAEQVVFYRGADNVPYAADGFAATVSLWMRLDPDQDLEPGYVDPLQITDKTWNNAALFLDFTKDDQPRHFRLGVFSDYPFWNPQDRAWDSIPARERPMVEVARPPFARDRWTHVAFTIQDFNRPTDGKAVLYLDGEPQPPLVGPQRFTWNSQQVVIMLGIYYTGLMDELAVFDRALTADEIRALHQREQSLKHIIPD